MNKTQLLAAIASAKTHPRNDWGAGYVYGLDVAAKFAEQLDEQPAMTWQNPDRHGKCYVDDHGDKVVFVRKDVFGRWVCRREHDGDVLAQDRRVCYIPDPPPLERTSDEQA